MQNRPSLFALLTCALFASCAAEQGQSSNTGDTGAEPSRPAATLSAATGGRASGTGGRGAVQAGSAASAQRAGRGGSAADGGSASAASNARDPDATGPNAGALEDAGPAADSGVACESRRGTARARVSEVSVRGVGGKLEKGAEIEVRLRVQNTGDGAQQVKLTPLLDSQRFSDYHDARVGSTTLTLCVGETDVTVRGGPFFDGPERKRYAFGSGDYTVSGVTIEVEGQAASTQRDLPNSKFRVASSNTILVPVVYDERYFAAIKDNTAKTPEAYLTRSFTRPNEIFTPSSGDPDGPGDYKTFAGGFDAMLNVRHLFHVISGFPGERTTNEGWCEDAAAYAQQALGMQEPWDSRPSGTRPERHGFDYLIALTPDMGGGVACGWLDVQVSSLINNDVDRQQVIAVHESGHVFGAPHCDDVGDGSGGALQGYVMCSGEKHARYPGAFVWHSTSNAKMQPHWD